MRRPHILTVNLPLTTVHVVKLTGVSASLMTHPPAPSCMCTLPFSYCIVSRLACSASACCLCSEDAETVYFNESAAEARKAVGDVLDRWQGLLAGLAAEDQAKLQRAMGLKIEQLKAELKELDELHA